MGHQGASLVADDISFHIQHQGEGILGFRFKKLYSSV
jgi:hypothetical protein